MKRFGTFSLLSIVTLVVLWALTAIKGMGLMEAAESTWPIFLVSVVFNAYIVWGMPKFQQQMAAADTAEVTRRKRTALVFSAGSAIILLLAIWLVFIH
ncbi:hypothetical protein SAMN05421878_10592 [Actinobaculum suis]|uniref:Uncharacterized protein n=1 Tax=Actinobaculum suis TaxID=1657 RepID=A0A1B9BC50_9ACTO|nr:hypothetical protein [Actinobaculum suis]MDY5153804.1 hypothetical protein [Actinobaculum suis]OCA94399.1 hypothetical protein ACU21_06700 [Actinobaculum suis]SDE29097.1 hypothetical protein SAMN05421878_10592 [Actinobaculum suis]VDG76662.1 Uncharacterised protein [Actinobaculum suis]